MTMVEGRSGRPNTLWERDSPGAAGFSGGSRVGGQNDIVQQVDSVDPRGGGGRQKKEMVVPNLTAAVLDTTLDDDRS